MPWVFWLVHFLALGVSPTLAFGDYCKEFNCSLGFRATSQPLVAFDITGQHAVVADTFVFRATYHCIPPRGHGPPEPPDARSRSNSPESQWYAQVEQTMNIFGVRNDPCFAPGGCYLKAEFLTPAPPRFHVDGYYELEPGVRLTIVSRLIFSYDTLNAEPANVTVAFNHCIVNPDEPDKNYCHRSSAAHRLSMHSEIVM